ncbi:MAG: hypothetical protein WC333_00820 [Dehalococcoidia bacterium]|jgi:hypothetical protein
MLKNDDRVLWNDGKVFRAQVVNSYINNDAYYYHNLYIGFSGVSTTNPLKVYFAKPTGLQKNSFITNSSSYLLQYTQTTETSQKKFYFSGNLNAVYYLYFNNPYTGYYYRGDFIKLINEFPNLNRFIINQSYFNQNISYGSFPSKLRELNLNDPIIYGNINTITNFEKLERLYLTNCDFTGNLSNIDFENLGVVQLSAISYLNCNLNDLVENNPNLYNLMVYDSNLITGNATTLDVSQLNYIYFRIHNTPGITGSITDWTFNTGLTYFYLYHRYLTGNITDWDFSDTKIDTIYIDSYSNYNNISGDTSNWVLPNTLNSIGFDHLYNITAIPQDFTTTPLLNSMAFTYLNSLRTISGVTFNSNLNSINIGYCPLLVDDINTINFNNKLSTIQMYYCSLTGDIGNFVVPTGTTYINFNSNDITGNISGITFNNVIQTLYLQLNPISGDIINMSIPNSLNTFYISNTDVYVNFDNGVFHTKNLTVFSFESISGITGNLSNLIFDNNMSTVYLRNTNINADLSNLNPSKVNSLAIDNCGSMYGNISNWITGTTILSYLTMSSNPHLTGNLINWDVNDIYYLDIHSCTGLTGALKHNNVQYLYTHNTGINSNIATDFNFLTRGYVIQMNNCSNLTGSLSGVTLSSGLAQFYVYNCPNIVGSNAFINYLFTYRKYFTYIYTVTINFSNIGEAVTGTSETLGDLGTYSGSSTGWDLTEEEVNNLAVGTDYDGLGTNTPWDSKQKVYWIENAKISSTNLNYRYVRYNITY